jgi:hypothetical protein
MQTAQQRAAHHNAVLLNQKRWILYHYDHLDCSIKDGKLVCRGKISSPDYLNIYYVEITYRVGSIPFCKILEPTSIVPCLEIHMADDRSLCLYFPEELKWNDSLKISDYFVPWLSEWVLYYEIYLRNGGKWLGPKSPPHLEMELVKLNNNSINDA